MLRSRLFNSFEMRDRYNKFFSYSFRVFLVLTAFVVLGPIANAQTDASGNPFPPRGDRDKTDRPKTLDEQLAKLRLERAKKDHKEMLDRGEEALRLTDQLERSFEQSESLSPSDLEKLESLEKVVIKIRKGLGGDDDDDEAKTADSEKTDKPSTLKEAFTFLKQTTVKLVDELKKTSRFSISAAAIRSSNTVIKLARFLRLRQ